ncbi:MAG: flagellar hook-associated protein FlgK [Candidatus Methylomirabilales bacterium]
MSGLFGTLGVARSGLTASQLALQTTANNVANAGTAGYTRQRADLEQSLPETLPVGQLGTGVRVDDIRRLRDRYLDQQFYLAQQTLGEREAQHAALAEIEALLAEPSEAGLRQSLSDFFTALSDLSSYPTDLTSRRAVLEQGRTLAGSFNRLAAGLADMKRNMEAELVRLAADANGLIAELGTLNSQIQAVTIAGGSPNALMDQRDRNLDELARLVGITRTDRSDGAVQVSLAGGGGLLVDGTATGTLAVRLSTTQDAFELTLDGAAVRPSGGRIDGLLHARNDRGEYVKYVEEQLDTLAATLIRAMNGLQAGGAGLVGLAQATSTNAVSDPSAALGSAGLPFPLAAGSLEVFVYDATDAVTGSASIPVDPAATSLDDLAAALDAVPGLTASVAGGRLTVGAAAGSTFRFGGDASGALTALGLGGFFTGTTARSIAVDEALAADPRLLATGEVDAATGGVAPGDTQVVRAMAGLREALLLQGGSASLLDVYAQAVGVVGARTAAMAQQGQSQALVVETVQNRREQVSGVSLNEEMAELVRLQYAFQASARTITVVDELLNTVVNGILR